MTIFFLKIGMIFHLDFQGFKIEKYDNISEPAGKTEKAVRVGDFASEISKCALFFLRRDGVILFLKKNSIAEGEKLNLRLRLKKQMPAQFKLGTQFSMLTP